MTIPSEAQQSIEKILSEWDKLAEEDLAPFKANPSFPFLNKSCDRILQLIKLCRTYRGALSHCKAAMKYAYEDHSDQYYLNVLEQIETALAADLNKRSEDWK